MTHTPSLAEATVTVEVLKVDTLSFCAGADAAMAEIEALSPSIPENGKSTPLGDSKEVEPSWACLWENDATPSRLLHDICRPDTEVTPFIFVGRVTVKVTREFHHRDSEQRYNEEMSKLLMDTMRVDTRLLVVGERRDTVLRGVRRNQFRSAKAGYKGKEGDGGKDDKPEATSLLFHQNKGFYLDQIVSLYGKDYLFRNSCTKRDGYAEEVKRRIAESQMHNVVKRSLHTMLYAALYNPIVDGGRIASRYRSPKFFKTEILDQMLYWAAIYPSHLAAPDQHNERTFRPLFARWYLEWGVRIGKFFTPLGSRQHNGKSHILFLFDGHRTSTSAPYEPPYHLYTHVGNNIMFRGVPFYQYTRAGTKNMHRSNNVTIYGGIHHVPTDAEKDDPPVTCFRTFSSLEDQYKTKMYTVTTHISGRSVPTAAAAVVTEHPVLAVAPAISGMSMTPAIGRTPLPPTTVTLETYREMAATPIGSFGIASASYKKTCGKPPPPPKRSRYMASTPTMMVTPGDIWDDDMTPKKTPPPLEWIKIPGYTK